MSTFNHNMAQSISVAQTIIWYLDRQSAVHCFSFPMLGPHLGVIGPADTMIPCPLQMQRAACAPEPCSELEKNLRAVRVIVNSASRYMSLSPTPLPLYPPNPSYPSLPTVLQVYCC